MIKKLIQLIIVMAALSIAGAVGIKLTGIKSNISTTQSESKIKVVATFYPVYLIGLNIADQMEGMEVDSLTKLNTGCLHDYQLTTQDMKLISSADVLIINGGGMEGFLEDIKANYPNLTIIDASQDITMLPNITSGLIQNTETSGDQNTAEGTLTLSEEEAYNAHVWLDPKLYRKQIENVRDGLINYINSSTNQTNINKEDTITQIQSNADKYIQSVEKLDNEIENFKNEFATMQLQASFSDQVVIFHESFAYLANRIGMKVAFTVPLDSDTALSAGDIAAIIKNVREQNIKYLFTEQQFSDSIAKQIGEETGAKVYIIDSVVTGDGSKDAYLKAMQNNLKVLKAAVQE